MKTFASGARRSEQKPRYDLIPKFVLERIAARFALGLRYGEHNYKLGSLDLEFSIDSANHAIDHILNHIERMKALKRDGVSQGSDDDLAGAIVSLMFVMCHQEPTKVARP